METGTLRVEVCEETQQEEPSTCQESLWLLEPGRQTWNKRLPVLPQSGAGPCPHLGFGLLACRTVRVQL